MKLLIVFLVYLIPLAKGCFDQGTCAKKIGMLKSQNQTLLTLFASLMEEEIPFISTSSKVLSSKTNAKNDVITDYCPNKAAFEWITVYQATIKMNSSIQFNTNGFNSCFKTMKVQFHSYAPGGIDGGDQWGYLHFTVPLPSKLVCSDGYVIGTKYATRHLDVGTIDHITKKMHLNITYLPGEYNDILQNGLQIMVKPCGSGLGTIQSIIATVDLFYNKNATLIRDANKKFLTYRGVYDQFTTRIHPEKVTAINKNKIKSGDNLQVVKLDGLDPLIAWGTGGRTGHTAIAVWDKNHSQLYVCESTDKSPFGTYWPPPYGIIKTPFDQWFAQAVNASFVVNILPLSTEAAAGWNNNDFWNWFETVEGMPYGYHVMLYSFLDTHDPAKNLPKPLNDETINFILPYLDRIVRNDNTSIGSNMYSLIGEGLNHRLKTNCIGNNMQNCLSDALVKRNLSYAEATAIPEEDQWKYDSNGTNAGNYSMMCSAFVQNAYKVAFSKSGKILPKELNSHEFTPKDVYQQQIFDVTGTRFDNISCPSNIIVDKDGRGTYCQMIGDFILELPGFNSIKPYPHMNDHCTAQWPGYEVTRPC
jgi:hypothetical protein